MPLNHNTLAGLFSDIADAIRAKTGGSSQITADDFPTAIGAIQTGTPKAAQTYYPSTSDQTIASGYRLTGTQTFKGVLLTNLSEGNIKAGVTVTVGDSVSAGRIANITGTYSGGGGGGSPTISYYSGVTDNEKVSANIDGIPDIVFCIGEGHPEWDEYYVFGIWATFNSNGTISAGDGFYASHESISEYMGGGIQGGITNGVLTIGLDTPFEDGIPYTLIAVGANLS